MVLWILLALFGFRLRGFHSLWLAFPKPFSYPLSHLLQSEPQNARTLVWAPSISLAATLEIDFSFSSSGYLDVSVHRVPSVYLWIQYTVHEVFSCGFPHSDICGSMDICSSPQLFAAYHVFLRLLVPRHPPCALISLTFHIHSVECAVVVCAHLSMAFVTLLLFFIYRRMLLRLPRMSFLLSLKAPSLSSARFFRQFLRFLFLLYSVFKVPFFGYLSAIKNHNL